MQITEEIFLLDCSKGSRVYLVKGAETILIDSGLPGLATKILSELNQLGVSNHDIKKILVTHHDIDHIGNAKIIQDRTQAQVWAPQLDIPYIKREKKREGIKRFLQLIIHPEIPNISGDYNTCNEFGEILAIHAPGHTPGHTIFQYKNVVFTGDLFRVNQGVIKITPSYMNWDHEEIKKSIMILKTLDFEWICPSHSNPVKRKELRIGF